MAVFCKEKEIAAERFLIPFKTRLNAVYTEKLGSRLIDVTVLNGKCKEVF